VDAAPPGLLILVPARAGSRGVPGKNLKLLGGIPLLEWTARAIRASSVRGRAVLSTEDEAIAEVGRAAGLETPFLRPAALAGDATDMVEVVRHAVEALEGREGWRPRTIMLLQPTCPFRRPARLREALDVLEHTAADAVIGMTALHRSPALLYREDDAGWLSPLAPWDAGTIRQRVRPTLTPNGTLYLSTRESLERYGRLFPPRLRAITTTAVESIDIDTPEDWALAEAVVAAGLASA
jgi:N-acylneuraminate cytidylyltransferase/CMP-N,N'-diacetyllegionaminic acid synthase